MQEVKFSIPDEVATVSVDVAVHFNSDLAAVEAFARLSREIDVEPDYGYGDGDQLFMHVKVQRGEVTYYGPRLRDRSTGASSPQTMMEARIIQLRQRAKQEQE